MPSFYQSRSSVCIAGASEIHRLTQNITPMGAIASVGCYGTYNYYGRCLQDAASFSRVQRELCRIGTDSNIQFLNGNLICSRCTYAMLLISTVGVILRLTTAVEIEQKTRGKRVHKLDAQKKCMHMLQEYQFNRLNYQTVVICGHYSSADIPHQISTAIMARSLQSIARKQQRYCALPKW